MFTCVSSGSCQGKTAVQCLHNDHSSTLVVLDEPETGLIFQLLEKNSNCPSFWKIECHRTSSVGVGFHLLCGFQDQTTVIFSPVCLFVDTELIVTPMIHRSTSELHCSVFEDTTQLSLFQKVDSFPQLPRVCFFPIAFMHVLVSVFSCCLCGLSEFISGVGVSFVPSVSC